MVVIGRYRSIVVIEKPRAATSGDAFKAVDYSDDANWIELFSRRAAIEPAQGREFVTGSQTSGEVSHIVRMRYDAETKSILPTYRLRLGDGVSRRVFGIVGKIDVNERHRELVFQCLEESKQVA